MRDVRRSVFKYIKANYNTTPVVLPFNPEFDAENEDEWIKPSIIGPVGVASRADQQHENYILGINIYSRIDLEGSGNRLDSGRVWEIADELKSLLEKSHINYFDNDDTYLGAIILKEAEYANLGFDGNIVTINVTIDMSVIRDAS